MRISMILLGLAVSTYSYGKTKGKKTIKHRENFYMGMGLLDQGHTISISGTSGRHFGSYLHKVNKFKGEMYVSDSLCYGYKINKSSKYSLFLGGALGLEQHEKSVYFGQQYITLRPRVSLWKRYNKDIAIGIDMEFGKGFWQTKKRNRVDAPIKGYLPRPEVSIGFSFKFN